jgi:uncharacterized protein (TIGR00730 family)
MTSKRVTVYCASTDKCDKKFFDAGRQLGEALALLNITVVYGGAHKGVMGAVADGALNAQGKVIGWIPTFMTTEVLHPGLTEVHKVETMHLRKDAMMMNSDALIALPGGTGTVEELMQALNWHRLKLIDPLLKLFANMVKEHFISNNLEKYLIVVESIDDVIKKNPRD